jgi:hypothetical protein
MTFSTLRPYFEQRMLAVDAELKEWEDGFNIDNIPSSILDKSWHIQFNPFSYNTGGAHTCLSFNCPVTLNVFFKGYRNPKEAIDTALIFADAIIKECTKPVQRLNQPKIKNVLPSLVSVRELDTTNDNAAVLELQFNCEVKVEP